MKIENSYVVLFKYKKLICFCRLRLETNLGQDTTEWSVYNNVDSARNKINLGQDATERPVYNTADSAKK